VSSHPFTGITGRYQFKRGRFCKEVMAKKASVLGTGMTSVKVSGVGTYGVIAKRAFTARELLLVIVGSSERIKQLCEGAVQGSKGGDGDNARAGFDKVLGERERAHSYDAPLSGSGFGGTLKIRQHSATSFGFSI
jgi:hypothetical protein